MEVLTLKKWKWKIALSALSLSLVLPLSAGAAGKFSDVGPRFENEINYLAERNIAKGYSNGTFGVNATVTRAEATVMIIRELGIRWDGAKDPGFTDFKKGDGFYTEVAAAVEQGVIQGKVAKDGTRYFDPSGSLTRAEMAIILARAYDIPLDRRDIPFKDVSSTTTGKKEIDALFNGGISFGYENLYFKPYAKITRQEFAGFLGRTVNKEFNPMYMEYVHYDPDTLQRVKPTWLTEQQLNAMETEMIASINNARIKKGYEPIVLNEGLQDWAGLKIRAMAKYPYDERMKDIYKFYEDKYGEKLNGDYTERYADGSVESALQQILSQAINEPSLYDASRKEMGVGVAQEMDGSFTWVISLLSR